VSLPGYHGPSKLGKVHDGGEASPQNLCLLIQTASRPGLPSAIFKSQRWNPKTFVAWRPRLATEPLVKIVDEVRDLEGKPSMTPRLSQLWQVEAG